MPTRALEEPVVRDQDGSRRMPRLLQRVLIAAIAVVVATYLVALAVTVLTDGWIRASVTIDAPVEMVWDYGSDSTRAAEWSVYFHHITPVEGAGRAADGTVGALRWCFRNEDETGIRWDETTEAITTHEHRQIRTFNLVGFPMGPIGRAQEYEVHQDYERLGSDRTRLTFRSKITRQDGLGHLLAWPLVKASYVTFGAPAGQEVFVWNLANIAEAIESAQDGRSYERPYPYREVLPWETKPLRWWAGNRWDAIRS